MSNRKVEMTISVEDGTNFDKFQTIYNETMPGFLNVGLEKVTGDAQANSPVGVRGLFRGGVQPSLESVGAVTFQGYVFSSVNYAPIVEGVNEEGEDVEFGRRPYTAFPNIGELKLWVEKVISPPEEEIDDVTRIIGWHIVHHGIKAKRPIGNAFDSNKDLINREIDRGVEKVFSLL